MLASQESFIQHSACIFYSQLFTFLEREVEYHSAHSAVPLHNSSLSQICQEAVVLRDFAWIPLYSTTLF